MAIRVVFGEDNYLVREGVQHLLEREPDIEVVVACEDLPSLLESGSRRPGWTAW